MPQVKVYNMAGSEVGTMALSEKIFGADVNGAVLHAAVRASHRAEVRGRDQHEELLEGQRRPDPALE